MGVGVCDGGRQARLVHGPGGGDQVRWTEGRKDGYN